MTEHRRRPRGSAAVVLLAGIAMALGLAGIAAAWSGVHPGQVEIAIRYSHYLTTRVSVERGVPVTFELRNDDPIDHEWIVGDEAVHERHRTGTEPVHGARPTEVTIPAGTTRYTTVTFPTTGTFQFICHLPGHEAYGMIGTVVVVGG